MESNNAPLSRSPIAAAFYPLFYLRKSEDHSMRRFLSVLLFLVLFSNEARSQSGGPHTPYASAASETNAIIKASRGSFIHMTFANVTANAGWVVVLNSITVPADTAAITPLLCIRVAATTSAEADYSYATMAFNVGIVVLATAAATCYTRTNTAAPSGLFTVIFE